MSLLTEILIAVNSSHNQTISIKQKPKRNKEQWRTVRINFRHLVQ